MFILSSSNHNGTFSAFQRLKSDVECSSSDTKLGDFNTLAECADTCRKRFRSQPKHPRVSWRSIYYYAKCCFVLPLSIICIAYYWRIEVGFFQGKMMYLCDFSSMEFNSCVPRSMVFQERMQVFRLWQGRCVG